ncbi:MAG: TonB family protein [Novosphingobium sp.]|nr:MAG: TonB family protein [Novosphingobium sp.]
MSFTLPFRARHLVLASLSLLPTIAHAAPAGTSQGAQPSNYPGNWATTADYPPEALAARIEGAVNFLVTIGTDGAVRSCEITQTSGSAILDTKTCALITERARFSPARDAYGTVVEGRYSNRVRWALPSGDLPQAEPKDVAYSCIVEIDGRIAGCTVLRATGLDDTARRGLEAFVSSGGKTKPYLDEGGKPVRRRVIFEQSVSVEPVS